MDAPSSSAVATLPTTTEGKTLAELSQQQPVFLVLLRHAGCTFHREALADLKQAEPAIKAAGARLAIVHLGDSNDAIERASPRYDLRDVTHVADPERRLYRELGLPRGRLGQLFGWREFSLGFRACLLERHGVGPLKGDGFQLGGMALIDHGAVVWKRALASASERPDYVAEATTALCVSGPVR
ncbi:hypothetical protein Pla108_37670 [Botrimarina colliarenosi]|uniref:AhpC/TSA family protein n=1 Tax=Botrimarina colliarenosi TaxID=2528001 RepID=A0A5C6A3V9_9BACT|nr:AhpC/TSA family protein [Botrimarina colliarenosi]TWT94055.1 hypothetical protein Pla108_37670 [Botrimarina colliarenosi]